MTLLRSNLVREEALFEMAKYISLGDYILLGAGELKAHGNVRASIVSDVFEALIGAIYFDQGLEVAEKLCDKVAIIKGGKLIVSGTMEDVKGDTSLEEVFLEMEEEVC